MGAAATQGLTVQIRCHEHAERIQRLVAHVRPYAGDVVVAADARMSERDLALIAAAGPVRLLRLPWLPPSNRSIPYLNRRSAGAWVLRLDGDEVPSTALLERLPELVADRRFTHYLVPVVWCWPDLGHRLAERPWTPDVQPRLLRNDPALVHVPARMHSSAVVAGAARILDALPIHHLDLAVRPLEDRRAKVAAYDRVECGRTVLGRPLNQALYLPEDYAPRPAVLPLPAAERALLERIAAGPVLPPARRRAARSELVAVDAIEAPAARAAAAVS
jgi:hypothetical protein